MSQKAKRIFLWALIITGLAFGMIGWLTGLYSDTIGTVILVSVVIIHMILRHLWGLRS